MSHPGPGVTIMTTPKASRVNPKRIFRNRLAWLRVLIINRSLKRMTAPGKTYIRILDAAVRRNVSSNV